MKRWLYVLVALAAVGALSRLPHPAMDVGKLEPVAVVRVEIESGRYRVETDTGASGVGADLAEAVTALKESASGEVFLDTADFLLIDGNVGESLLQLIEVFRPGCAVCRINGETDLDVAAKYLTIHRPEVTLAHLRAGQRNLQTLELSEGGGTLVGP